MHCKSFVFSKYHLIKTFLLILICFQRMIMAILLPILIKCTVSFLCNKPYCYITVVATRVTKQKRSGHITPRCAYVTML